ncbi:MAG TPA: tRNA (adenosine(37)-N6)-threonylcarbamoyltransferase complex transferase subunit TsaD, partial [Tepidisphaeraceae bacterium]
MSLVLGIESTCDETGAAVVRDGVEVLSNVVASQVELHAKYRGVVPEIASRAHIENILPVVREAVRATGVKLADVDAVAVAHRPGLIGSLLIGVTAAKTLAWSLRKPLVGVDHVWGHLYSVELESERRRGEETERRRVEFPAVGLVASGGHTSLYELRSWTDIKRLGGTIDDAVGEGYDKVAAILGLGYPGGPIIDRLAREGDAAKIQFPRTLLGRESLDFSFSGLKTAVLYHVRGVPGKPPRTEPLIEREIRDVAAGFQAACVEVIVKKLQRALHRTGAKCVIIGGGVSANSGLRQAVTTLKVPVHVPALEYCTDNAAMSAGL